MSVHAARVRAFADSVRQAGITDVVLLGMGGSSLVSEVMRASVGVASGFPRFRVLDSVDPEAVREAMERAATTLFILASKSGSTIELVSLAAEAERRLQPAVADGVGSHFVAITDDNTALHRRAIEQRFREAFINPSDIGGRFSALSLFGLVPAALMGIEIDRLSISGQDMAAQCRVDDPHQNPGVALGAFIAAASTTGRDKLTVLLPEPLNRFGLWAEQLVAESTGKQGKGIIPITDGAFDPSRARDRVLVAIVQNGEHDASIVENARAADIPLVTLHVPDVHALGAEFFRWEVATATAGWLLQINPFDEPNVQQAKDATGQLLASYAAHGRLPVREPHGAIDGARLVATGAATADGLFNLVKPGDYFSLLAYLPPDDAAFLPTLNAIRTRIADQTGCATMLGFGPRYLHSTGQLFKGGPNTGVFLIVTAEPSGDLPVPGESYTFGILEMAQALGDFESLDRLGRRALHLHLPRRDPLLLQQVVNRILNT
jgi:glucose-6-phosphate isomerase